MAIPAVMPTYARYDLTFERGEGPWLITAAGRRYLDFGGGVAVASFGHCHPHLVRALTDQAHRLWHTSNLYHIPQQRRLAERLVEASFADTAFFCNSGAEANEGAFKIARRRHQSRGENRYRIIAAHNAFHGRTLATLSASGQTRLLDGFAPAVEGFDHTPFGDLDETRAAITDRTAAIMVEPIQGEGGVVPADERYLRGLRALCDEFGLLLIFDEIQCGIGRTGKLFAHEWAGVTPDVMTAAKGLGGGFPIGAILAAETAASCMTPGVHGSTFGGAPLAMAVANAVLDLALAPGFLDRVLTTSGKLWDALTSLAQRFPDVVSTVRGKGYMIGLKCVAPNADLIRALAERGLLSAPGGDNVVRLLPPLIVGEDDIAAAAAMIEGAFEALRRERNA